MISKSGVIGIVRRKSVVQNNTVYLLITSTQTNKEIPIQINTSLAFHIHKAVHIGDMLLLTHCHVI